jgi:hypothetical protein
MKKIFVLTAMFIFTGTFAQATGLNIKTYKSLDGVQDKMDYHLTIDKDGTITTWMGRQMPYNVTIVSYVDDRPVDGYLTINLSNGTQLIQTIGRTADGRSHIYLVNDGVKVEMNSAADLEIVK